MTRAKVIYYRNNNKYITYFDSDGYPSEVLPIIIENWNQLITDGYPLYSEESDPNYDYDYLYIIDFDTNLCRIIAHGYDVLLKIPTMEIERKIVDDEEAFEIDMSNLVSRVG